MIFLWNWYISHIRPVKNYIFYRVLFVVKRGTDTALSQGGYDDTWMRFKARYQNGKILILAVIANIIDHKPIDGSSRQLRSLHDTIKNSISTLKNQKKTRPAVSSCSGKFSGCTNGNSKVKECTDVY